MCASVGRPKRTSLQLLFTGTGSSLELQETIGDRDECLQKVRETRASSATCDDNNNCNNAREVDYTY